VGDQPREDQLDLESLTTLEGSPEANPEPAIRVSSEPVQGGLFPDDSVPDELVGYRGPSGLLGAHLAGRAVDSQRRRLR